MTEKGKRMVFRLVVFLCFCANAVMPFPLSVSTFPRDESEASVMIREGLLDSLDWERIRQFYVQPLNVPSGDLRYLKELTELWVDDIPVSLSQLKPYEPWAEADIRRFFSDFPQLAVFQPVLSFETEQTGHRSDVSLNVHAGRTLRPVALSRFASCIGPRFSFSGSVYHEDSTLLWRTKMINILVPGIARIEAGNFGTADDRGLFFGYFPEDREAQTTASNWLYGGARTWNGVMAATDCWDRFRVSAFFHERRTENVQAFACRADAGRWTEVMVGVSRLSQTHSGTSPATPDSTYYLQGGIQGRLAGFEMSANTGIDAARPLAVPLSAQVSRKSAGGFVKFLVARIPGSLRLPMSSIAYLCRRDLDTAGQNGVFPDMTLIECRTSLYMGAGSETSMDLYSIVHDRGVELQATACMEDSSVVGYRLEYSCRAQSDRPQTIHNVNLIVQRTLRPGTAVSLSCRYYYRDNGFQSVFFRVPLDIKVMSAMVVSPFFTIFSSTSGEHAVGAGLRQTLHCFNKTWCEWSGQVSRDERDVLDWNVGVRTDFLF